MTWKEDIDRVKRGERFEDPEILAKGSLGKEGESYVEENGTLVYPGASIAHVQASLGWTTLDPDILSLKDIYGRTVLDRMIRRGWKPKTEEEKLVIFTVKAGA